MLPRFILTPFFLDQHFPGLEQLQGADYAVNKPVLPCGNPQTKMVELYKPLAQLVETAASSGDMPVSLAGDCCSSIGVLAGLQRAGIDPALVWFDAHGDFNTWETTPSGFLGGMPLAMLVGRGEQTIMQGVGAGVLPEKQVILSDARDLDPGEREAVAGSQITHLRQVGELLDYDLPPGPLWVHFDTDVIDAEEAPAMNYPTPNGPSASALGDVFSHLAGSGQVAAVSISSWNPQLDIDGHSQEVVMGLVERLLLH